MQELSLTSQNVLIPFFDPDAAMWRDLTITLTYSWTLMTNVVTGTGILCGGPHMNRDEGELDAISG